MICRETIYRENNTDLQVLYIPVIYTGLEDLSHSF